MLDNYLAQKHACMHLDSSQTTHISSEFDQSPLCTPTTPTHKPLLEFNCPGKLYRSNSSTCGSASFFMSPQPISPHHHADFSMEYLTQTALLSPSETIISENNLSYRHNSDSVFCPGYSQSTPQSPCLSPQESSNTLYTNRRHSLMALLDQENLCEVSCSTNELKEFTDYDRIQFSTKSPSILNQSDANRNISTNFGNKFQYDPKKIKSRSRLKGLPISYSCSSLSTIRKFAAVSESDATKLKSDTPVANICSEQKVVRTNKNKVGTRERHSSYVEPSVSNRSVNRKSDQATQKKSFNRNLVISITNSGRAVLTGDDWNEEKEKSIDDDNSDNDELPARPRSAPGETRNDDAINALKQVIARRTSVTSSIVNDKMVENILQAKISKKNDAQTNGATKKTTTFKKSCEKISAYTSQQITSARLKTSRKAPSSLFPKFHKTKSIWRRDSFYNSKSSVTLKKSSELNMQNHEMAISNESHLLKASANKFECNADKIDTLSSCMNSSHLPQTPHSIISYQSENPPSPVTTNSEPFTVPTTAAHELAYSLNQQQQQQQPVLQNIINCDYPVSFSNNHNYHYQQQTFQTIPSSEAFVISLHAQHPDLSVYNSHQVHQAGAEYFYNFGGYYPSYQLTDLHYHLQHELVNQTNKLQYQQFDQGFNQFSNTGISFSDMGHMTYLQYPSLS